ncbi:MAG: hypothetical protein ACXW0T_12975 [Methylobacter sp.]
MEQEQLAVKIADVVVTLILGLIGYYLANSYRRKIALSVAEKRLAAYSALWNRMVIASPVRQSEWMDEPLTSKERNELFKDFTAWYYENGNGMLLGGGTRTIYLRVKDNLVCPIDYYEPESIRTRLKMMSYEEQEKERGRLSIRQLSLLRSRMKADLEVYGPPYHNKLDDDAKAFLRWCGEDLTSKVWKG